MKRYSVKLLQWGRRCSSPEMIGYRDQRAWRVLASMGPAMFIAGDAPWMRWRSLQLPRFNGAGDVHRRRFHAHAMSASTG